MGPPSLNGGWESTIPLPCRDGHSFNGATVSQRWMAEIWGPMIIRAYVLQWGHRLSTVDGAGEPRLLDVVGVLQWGHRLSTVDGGRSSSEPCSPSSLQWGHRLSTVDGDAYTLTATTTGLLQWGHRLSTVDGAETVVTEIQTKFGFNGATVSQRWMVHLQARSTRRNARASMGPPSLNGGWILDHDADGPGIHASMGPPSLNGGWDAGA